MPERKTDKIKSIRSQLQQTPIAIIGMSALYPQAKNVRQYWDNIVKEVDCITTVPSSRWNIDEYYDPDPSAEDKTYCKRGGFIPDIDFDPMEFGLPPNILEVTDVHQLLSLVLAKEVLRDAGYENLTEKEKETIGVILGVGGGQKLMIPLISRLQYPIWEKVLKSSGLSDSDTQKIVEKIKKAYVGWEENAFPGALGNVIAGRIANRLNLGGINCVVDAACASSFSGIRMAVSELLEHRSNMMITGGVDTDNSPYMYLCFSKTQAFTHHDKSRPFDVKSDGMIMGEGIGMVLLKRLEDAERDKDRIYAVIKGIGSSSDGRFKSIYAPRPKGQALALERAYKDAGISPSSVDLIETHGTGTVAGDLAEITALKDFFGKHDQQKQHIGLGSVKSQIGHVKNAAGSAGLIKTTLALYHKVLPATINITAPNPDFELEKSPFYLNTEVRPWLRPESASPRRAAVSAFGFGGTNFHFVLEEYGHQPTGNYRLHTVSQSFLFSAPSSIDLVTSCEKAMQDLENDQTGKVFEELSNSAALGKVPLGHARIGFVAESSEEAVSLLKISIKTLTEKTGEEFWKLPQGIFYRKKGIDSKGKVVALFAGQGSPYLNMGKELACNFPPLLKIQLDMDDLFIKDGLEPLSKKVYPTPVFDKDQKKINAAQLQLTEHAQPAIGVFSAGLFEIMQEAGFTPDFTAGHSFGELTALWAAGVFKREDFLELAKARGKAMAAPDEEGFDAGSMLAVVGEVDNIEEKIKDFPNITLANQNSKNQVVLAGPKKDILNVQKHLKKKKFRTVLLGVSAAFHTNLVGHAQKPFAKAIKSVKFSSAGCQVYSNATAQPYANDPKIIQKKLQDHILNSVLFRSEIENIYKEGGYIFVEFGPQNILTKLVDNILQDKPHISIALNANAKKDSDRQLREATMELRVAGLSLGNIDPYRCEQEEPETKKNALILKINGSNYVSEKTRKAFEEALQDGHKIQTGTAVPQELATVTTTPPPEINKPEAIREKKMLDQQTTLNTLSSLDRIERGLETLQQYQSETLRVHEQFLNNQSEYSRGFFQIIQQQTQAGSGSFSKEIAESIAQFHKYQGETLRIHEQHTEQQAENAKQAYQILKDQQLLMTNQNISQSATKPISFNQPPEPPAAVSVPSFQPPAPAPVVSIAQDVPLKPVVDTPHPPQTSATDHAKTGFSREILVHILLEVVSEKTGYQSDMLEMGMDMEADLGIDSIKRVEILNGIQERIPEMPQINPEELSELRTLAQIVEHVSPGVDGAMADSPVTTEKMPQTGSQPVSQTPAAGEINIDKFTEILLAVVSEKTGYQSDMLELSLDMEADLGIDSIKRVEILNAIQENLPDLPQVNPEELSELRTLAQIVDHMMMPFKHSASSAVEVTESEPVIDSPTSGSVIEHDAFVRILLEVVSEKTGYLVEMLELEMDMEADLGIDSIKRVEILNGIQEKLPGLPEVNPEEMSELRTLDQVVEKMNQAPFDPATTSGTDTEKKNLMN